MAGFVKIPGLSPDLDRVQANVQAALAAIPTPAGFNAVSVSKDYKATGAEGVLHVDASRGNVRITLPPTSAGNPPLTIQQVNKSGTFGTVTIVAAKAAKSISGANSIALDASGTGSVTLTCDGVSWWPSSGGALVPQPTPNQPIPPQTGAGVLTTKPPLLGGGPMSKNITLELQPATEAQDGYLSASDKIIIDNLATTFPPIGRLINTTGPLTGGGSLAADLTLAIAANGITAPLFRQSAAASLVGNPSGSPANVADITLGAGLAFSGSTLVNTSPLSSLTATLPLQVTGTDIEIRGAVTTGGTATSPTNLGALASGVLEHTVTGGVSAPSVFTATAHRLAFGSGSNGGLSDDAHITFNGFNPGVTSIQELQIYNDTSSAAGVTGLRVGLSASFAQSFSFSMIAPGWSSGGGLIAADVLAELNTGSSSNKLIFSNFGGGPVRFAVGGSRATQLEANSSGVAVPALALGGIVKAAATTGQLGLATVQPSGGSGGGDVQGPGAYITALTGDVTAAGPGSAAATIGSNKVTYGKIQTVGASSLLGNPTGSAANASEITLGTGLGLSGTTLVNTSPLSALGVTPPIALSGSTLSLNIDSTLAVVSSNLGRAAVTGDVTIGAGSNTAALANIPNDTTMAGDLLATGITAPAAPAAGKGRIWFDPTNENIASKGPSGFVNHGVQTRGAFAHFFLTGVTDSGSWSAAQPDFTDLTGTATLAQLPAIGTGLLGNPTGSSAAPSLITLGAGLAFSGTTLVNTGTADHKVLVDGSDTTADYLNAKIVVTAPITKSTFIPAPPATGLQLWLKADAGITLSGSKVSAWADQSGNGNNVAQATGANQPTFNASSVNSLPGVTFGASNTVWLNNTTTNPLSAGSARSILIVMKPGSATASLAQSPFTLRRSAGPGPGVFGTSLQAASGNNYYFTDGYVQAYQATQPSYANTALEAEWLAAAVGASASLAYNVNGTLVSSPTNFFTNTDGGATGFTVGNREDNGGSTLNQQFVGDICEILVYDHVLSSPDLAAVRAYLQNRYGITIAGAGGAVEAINIGHAASGVAPGLWIFGPGGITVDVDGHITAVTPAPNLLSGPFTGDATTASAGSTVTKVVAIHETGGPTQLTIGAIPDSSPDTTLLVRPAGTATVTGVSGSTFLSGRQSICNFYESSLTFSNFSGTWWLTNDLISVTRGGPSRSYYGNPIPVAATGVRLQIAVFTNTLTGSSPVATFFITKNGTAVASTALAVAGSSATVNFDSGFVAVSGTAGGDVWGVQYVCSGTFTNGSIFFTTTAQFLY